MSNLPRTPSDLTEWKSGNLLWRDDYRPGDLHESDQPPTNIEGSRSLQYELYNLRNGTARISWGPKRFRDRYLGLACVAYSCLYPSGIPALMLPEVA